MHALLIGATGATGKDLLSLSLNDNAFYRADIFARYSQDLQHAKLKVHIIGWCKGWHPRQCWFVSNDCHRWGRQQGSQFFSDFIGEENQ